MATARPLWLVDFENSPNFRRKAQMIAAGLHTGMGVPVMAESEVVAVLEFFTDELVAPNPDLLDALPHIGVQLGRVIERQRAEQALNKRAAELRTVVSNLPVILLALDTHGQILLMDGRGLASIGRQPGDLVGQSIYDLLDPNRNLQINLERAFGGQEAHTEIKISARIYEVFFSPYYDANERLEGVLALLLDVSTRKQMEAELDEIKHHLMESVENERMRLAKQIHDGPLQDLYGVFYQMQEVKSGLNQQQQARAESALDTIQKVNATLRFICGELRPTTLAHLGLKKAIRSHSERVQERHPNLSIHLDLQDDADQLQAGQRLGLYRIYQNLINNVVRHSQARHAWVRLTLLPEQLMLEVQDNGQGFETPSNWVEMVRKGHFGLTGAQERAEAMGGSLEVISRPGGGTLARATIPRASSAGG
jgi:PAS domain S-box-containing protein